MNLDTGVLHIPKPKGGEVRAFDLPLPTLLVDLFRARWVQHEKLFVEDKKTAPWVFAAPDSSSGHIVEVRAGRLGVSPHDMRRLFITCAESCDVSPYALKLLTNHALPRGDVTAGYTSVRHRAAPSGDGDHCWPPERALPAGILWQGFHRARLATHRDGIAQQISDVFPIRPSADLIHSSVAHPRGGHDDRLYHERKGGSPRSRNATCGRKLALLDCFR